MKRLKDFARLFMSISMLILIFFLAATFSIKGNSTRALQPRSKQIAPSSGLLITHPPDISFYHGTTGNTVSWTVTESGAPSRIYAVFANLSYLDNGKNWTSGIPVQESLDGLSTGIYNVTIVASDGLGNKVQDTVIITIMNPLLITHHGDYIIPFNSTGYHYIYWDLTDVDNSSSTYADIFFDGGLISVGGWVNKTTISQWVGYIPTTYVVPAPIGSYNYTMEATNSIDDTSWDTIVVTVVNPLTVTHPADIDYYHGNTGNFINWTLTFADWLAARTSYVVYQNGTNVASGNWLSLSYDVDYNVDGLPIGSYNFTIVARDPYGDTINDTVIVTVAHLLAVTHPGDFVNPRGNGGFNFDWYIIGADAFTPHYTIYKNGSNYGSGSWYNGDFIYVYPSMLLPIGSYNFTIVVTDGIGGLVKDTVNVTIVNPLAITHPADITCYYPCTGSIQWDLTNGNGAISSYTITQNGSLFGSGPWTYSHSVISSIDGLAVGSSNFTIVASDSYGDTISDTVIVTVMYPLAVTHPGNIAFYHRSTGHWIHWYLTDANGEDGPTYIVYENGTVLDSGSWVSSITVSEYIDGLSIGSYNFTIVASDAFGDTVRDTVIVTVWNPLAVSHPADIICPYGNSTSIQWHLTDASGIDPSYIVYKNGTTFDNGAWSFNYYVNETIDVLAVGSYNFTIVAWNNFGETVSDTVIITVPNVPPTITHPDDISYKHGATGSSISWNITDSTTRITSYIIYENGTVFENGTWTSGISINIHVNGLDVGSYNFTIVVYDGLGGSVNDTVILTVTNPSPQTISFDMATFIVVTMFFVPVLAVIMLRKRFTEN